MYIVYEPTSGLYFHSYKKDYPSLTSTNPLLFLWTGSAEEAAEDIDGEVYKVTFEKVEI